MERIEINNSAELLAVVQTLEVRFDQPLWFRGHYKPTWPLLPGAFRKDVNQGRDYYERVVNQMFLLRAAARHHAVPNRDNFAAWLFLMQHYRLPTRLLDWSESPLVAAFFALWNDRNPRQPENDSAVIYALAPKTLNERQLGDRRLFLLEDKEVRSLVPTWVLPGEAQAPAAPDLTVAAILPEQVDPRLVAQQGAFTIHAPDVALDTLPDPDQILTILSIPGGCRHAIRQDLLRMGVRPMNLFPDLDHLSADLKNFELVI